MAGFEYDSKTRVARYVVYEKRSGKKKRKTVTGVESRDQAIHLWSEFKRQVKDGEKPEQDEAPTFEEFINDYFDDVRATVKPKTAREYGYIVRNQLVPNFGALHLNEITAGKIKHFSDRLLAAGKSGATANNYANVMRLLLGKAVEWDVIGEHPVKKRIKKHEVNEPCNELSLEEERKFLAAFDDRRGFQKYLEAHMPRGNTRFIEAPTAPLLFGQKRVLGAAMRPTSEAAGYYFARFHESRPLFVVALETGLRRGDLLGLRWRAVDLRNGFIEMKTAKRGQKVTIPISDPCRAALEACRNRSVVSDNVFVDADGAPYSVSRIIRYFKIAKEIAGFGSDRALRFHDLRHTYGSKLAREGVNIEFIADTMAHTTTRMTKRYARPGSTALNAVKAALNRAASRDLGTVADDRELPAQIA